MNPTTARAAVRGLTGLGLAATLTVRATGCSVVNEQATLDVYAPSDGIIANVGDAELRNLLLVSKAPSSEARFLGSAFNDSDEPLGVVITIEGTSTPLNEPAGERLELGEPQNEHIIPDTGTFPCGLAEATIQAGDASQDDQIPVLDGTLEHYRPYVPGGWDPATLDHLYTTPAAPAGAAH
ncbi:MULTISPECIES: hypothetical protein [Micrococcaceae]|uniref:hypothetical protein n=1 Tax=Micrococcaceae TaxID=1268 RepID=UPI0016223BC4|nr:MULTISPECIES: hypothetical protein [Micrococcaceae]MBB5750077.1 hypothetical protein [Micrococcus sp. TA1]HRO94980.1 hypothetical protein [Citricoccus sp.]